MQTFLPYSDFRASAAVLDTKRVFKQAVEAWQVLAALDSQSHGYHNHPAVRQWLGYRHALTAYYMAMRTEAIRRGYRIRRLPALAVPSVAIRPPWLGDERLHHSHRANLWRKAPQTYYGWTGIDSHEPYFWPSHSSDYCHLFGKEAVDAKTRAKCGFPCRLVAAPAAMALVS